MRFCFWKHENDLSGELPVKSPQPLTAATSVVLECRLDDDVIRVVRLEKESFFLMAACDVSSRVHTAVMAGVQLLKWSKTLELLRCEMQEQSERVRLDSALGGYTLTEAKVAAYVLKDHIRLRLPCTTTPYFPNDGLI